MTSERECFVYIVLPGETEFVTAGRFRWTEGGDGAVGRFVYGRSYRERPDAVELDPVELRLSARSARRPACRASSAPSGTPCRTSGDGA